MPDISNNLGLNLPKGSDNFDYDVFLRQNFQKIDDNLKPGVTETFTATEGQTVFNLANSYTIGNGDLAVTVDGVPQFVGSGYTETSTTSITFSEGLIAGQAVKVRIGGMVPENDSRFSSIDSQLADNTSKIDGISINVKIPFGTGLTAAKGDGTTNDSVAIQAIIDYIGNLGGGTVFFPVGTYIIDAPLTIDYRNVKLLGCGSSTVLKKTTDTAPNITRTYSGTPYNYNTPVIIAVLFPNDSYRSYFKLENMWFTVGGNYNVGIIEAPRNAHAHFKNLGADDSKFFYKDLNSWMISLENIRSRYSNIHFDITSGTSHFFKNVHCDQNGNTSSVGFKIDSLVYSSFEACGADSISQSYIIKNKASIALNGCGAEAQAQTLLIQDATVSINGGEYEFHLNSGNNGSFQSPWIFETNAIVSMTGTRFITKDFTTGGAGNWTGIDRPVIRGGAKVNMHNVDLAISNIPNYSPFPYYVADANSYVRMMNGGKEQKGWSVGNKYKDDYNFKLQGIDKTVSVPINTKTELFRIKNSTYGASIIGKVEIYAFSDYASSYGGVLYNTIAFSGSDKTDKIQSVTKIAEQNAVMTAGQTAPTVAYVAERDGTTQDLIISVTLTGSAVFKPYTFNMDISYQGRVGTAHSKFDCV